MATRIDTRAQAAKKTTKAAMRKVRSMTARAAKEAVALARALDENTLAAGTSYELNGVTFTVSKDGAHVRQANSEAPITREQVQYLLTNIRALDNAEVLNAVGKGVRDYLVSKDMLRVVSGMLWVTKKAQAHYELADPILFSGIKATYLK